MDMNIGLLLFIAFFMTVTLIIYGLLSIFDPKKKHVKRRLATLTGSEVAEQYEEEQEQEQVSLFRRVFYPLLREFRKSFRKRMPGEKVAKIELKLLQAGSPLGMAPVDFRLLQFFLILFLPFTAGLYGYAIKLAFGSQVVLVIAAVVAAILLPNFYLNRKIKERYKQAVRELPDTLDLLTVSLEAGLGFDSALSKLISKKTGVLSVEFHRCLEEIRLGKTRREALQGVRERLAVDQIQTLIGSIIQAEKLGIGLVTVLRVQSEEVRDQRKQKAEEEAMKAPIKMLFPLVLFIFPCIFIVLLGPAVIQFIETFSSQ